MFAPSAEENGKLLLIAPKYFGNSPKRNLFKRRLKSLFVNNQWYKHKFKISIKPISKKDLSYADLEKQTSDAIESFLKFVNQQIKKS